MVSTHRAAAGFSRLALVLVVVLLGTFAGYFFFVSKTKAPASPGGSADVVVESPTPNQQIAAHAPLLVRGKARGGWFFEANIPLTLLDTNGTVLGQIGGHADGEWMTADFVPFSGTITFSAPTTATGILRVAKDNPSGLPEHDAHVDIPVRFNGGAGQ